MPLYTFTLWSLVLISCVSAPVSAMHQRATPKKTAPAPMRMDLNAPHHNVRYKQAHERILEDARRDCLEGTLACVALAAINLPTVGTPLQCLQPRLVNCAVEQTVNLSARIYLLALANLPEESEYIKRLDAHSTLHEVTALIQDPATPFNKKIALINSIRRQYPREFAQKNDRNPTCAESCFYCSQKDIMNYPVLHGIKRSLCCYAAVPSVQAQIDLFINQALELQE